MWLELGVKRIVRQGAVSGDVSSQARPNRNLDFHFNALGGHWEKAQCIAVESADSGVEILSLPHSSCVALDKLLNLSAEFSIQLLHLQVEILLLPTSQGY